MFTVTSELFKSKASFGTLRHYYGGAWHLYQIIFSSNRILDYNYHLVINNFVKV